ncbi:MAG: hypothetical protein ACTSSN_08135 [Candidatus Heimdallarchaeaceae archaeon]
MKKGKGYIICANLLIIFFVGSLINVNPVNAYQSLSTDDQLLYYADYSHISDYNYQLLFETDLSPMYNSFWDMNHNEFTSYELHSYSIAIAFASDYELRHTMSFKDTYRNDYWDYYYYDYFSPGWFLGSSGSYNELMTDGYSSIEYLMHYNTVLNLDIMYSFGSSLYDSRISKSYTVNGISNMYTVDVYTYSFGDAGVNSYSYIDILYDEYYDYSYDYTYYVDNATGFLLEVEYIYDSQYWADFDSVYSTTVGTNVTRHYYDNYHNEYHFYLINTNAGLNPVSDANLPGLEWDWVFNYDITGSSDYVTAYFWLFDSSLMDIDVYLDGKYIETLIGLTAGHYFYDVYIGDIPVSYDDHRLKFVVTDYFDVSHVVEYSLTMFDQRFDWPQINGPEGDKWYEIGSTDTIFWTLTDENHDPDYYEFSFNGTILSSGPWSYDQVIGFNLHDKIFSPGDYLISIYASDLMGHETYKNLTIHASSDFVPPVVNSPADIYMKPGENKEIIWTISDDNPSSYKVKQNGSIIIDLPWAINNFNVNVSLNTLTLGTWVFEIEVKDSYGNINYDTIYVYVTEEGVNPTEPTGSNTITLDAPGLIFAVIGFLSITALTVYVKKRK